MSGRSSTVRLCFLVTACILAGFFFFPPVSAADLEFSGSVTEYISDGISMPVEGVQVLLVNPVKYGSSIQSAKIDDTVTDSKGEYHLILPSSQAVSTAEVMIEIHPGSKFQIKDIQTASGLRGGIGSKTGGTIHFTPPLAGKVFTNNNFILQRENAALPPGTVLVSAGSIQGTGGTAQVPLTIRGADSVGNMDIVLDISGCKSLEYVRALPGSLTESSLASAKSTGSAVNVAIVDPKGISGDGSLMFIEFTILPEVTPCDLKLTNVQGNKVNGNALTVLTQDGSFGSGELKGDCNKDGVITSVDALMALQMSTGEQVADLIADVNGDGKVTSFDASQILKQATENPVNNNAAPNMATVAPVTTEETLVQSRDLLVETPVPEKTMNVVRRR
jgi:hypothetical protein